MTGTVPCKLCGNPVTIDYGPDATPEAIKMMESLYKTATHSDCRNKMIAEAELAKISIRASEWSKYCPPLYLEFDINRIPDPAAYQKAMEWKFDAKRGLICFGPSRTGKTRTCWQLLKREYEAGRHIVSMTHIEFAQHIGRMYRDNTYSAERWMNVVRYCDILFVDDLGKSKFTSDRGESKASEEALFDIVDYRVNNMKPMIYTTQYDAQKLLDSMSDSTGEAFLARLSESSDTVYFT